MPVMQEIADWLAMTPISDDRNNEGAGAMIVVHHLNNSRFAAHSLATRGAQYALPGRDISAGCENQSSAVGTARRSSARQVTRHSRRRFSAGRIRRHHRVCA